MKIHISYISGKNKLRLSFDNPLVIKNFYINKNKPILDKLIDSIFLKLRCSSKFGNIKIDNYSILDYINGKILDNITYYENLDYNCLYYSIYIELPNINRNKKITKSSIYRKINSLDIHNLIIFNRLIEYCIGENYYNTLDLCDDKVKKMVIKGLLKESEYFEYHFDRSFLSKYINLCINYHSLK